MVDPMYESYDVVISFNDEIYKNQEYHNHNEMLVKLCDRTADRRALYQIKQRQYIEKFRQQLQANNWNLFATFNTYAYYACSMSETHEKVYNHMMRTSAYHLILELDETNHDHIQNTLNQIDCNITSKLNQLYNDKLINYSQWQNLIMNSPNNQFDILYFLPDTSKADVPFLPMVESRYRLTMNISRFLVRLLQPLYDCVTSSKTFTTSMDVIEALEEYKCKGFLQSTTSFVTLRVHELSSVIPHHEIYAMLQRFLRENLADRSMEGITKSTMLDLVRLVLENQYMLYDKKFYRKIHGGACNSLLMTLLMNIYMHYWQESLVNTLYNRKELFGRCFDELFFTWNDSQEKLREIIHSINQLQSGIQITLYIHNSIHFLDVHIQQYMGDLKIEVAHNLTVEPYALPYVVGHPRNRYQILLRAALLRAVKCCQSISDFVQEVENIEASFRHNQFMNNIMKDKIRCFFKEFGTSALEIHSSGDSYKHQSLYNYLRLNVHNYHKKHQMGKLKRSRQILTLRSKSSTSTETSNSKELYLGLSNDIMNPKEVP